MTGVATLEEALQRRQDTDQVTFTTGTVSGNQSQNFTLDNTGSDNFIDSFNFASDTSALPIEADILLIRPIMDGGSSTDTDLIIHEDSDREDIDEVIRITGISVNDNPQTFQPGSGNGVQFLNQDGDQEMFFRLVENSSNDAQMQIRIRWFNVRD